MKLPKFPVNEQPSQLLTLREYAGLLGQAPAAVRARVSRNENRTDGFVPVLQSHAGGRRMVRRSDVERLLQATEVTS